MAKYANQIRTQIDPEGYFAGFPEGTLIPVQPGNRLYDDLMREGVPIADQDPDAPEE